MLVRAVAISRQRLQTEAIGRLESDGNSCSHAPDSHAFRPTGNPLRDSNVRRDPLASSSSDNVAPSSHNRLAMEQNIRWAASFAAVLLADRCFDQSRRNW